MQGINYLQNFITLSLSIVIESLPFVVVGILISTAIALFVSEERLISLLPKNNILSYFVISLSGIAAPVCQCGNVPVARRLMLKGLSVSQATTFLLAAPIVNPLTFLTTWEAFPTNHSIAIIRLLAGIGIAVGIGLYISLQKNQELYLTKNFYDEICHIDHKPKVTASYALEIFQDEFMTIMRLLCFGAMIAAVTQVFVPKSIILSFGQSPFLSIFAMLTLGFVISICSTVDAFFALSYINTFTIGSLVTFLIFGPLVDIKMLFMMKSTFTTKFLITVSCVVALISIIIGAVFNYFSL